MVSETLFWIIMADESKENGLITRVDLQTTAEILLEQLDVQKILKYEDLGSKVKEIEGGELITWEPWKVEVKDVRLPGYFQIVKKITSVEKQNDAVETLVSYVFKDRKGTPIIGRFIERSGDLIEWATYMDITCAELVDGYRPITNPIIGNKSQVMQQQGINFAFFRGELGRLASLDAVVQGQSSESKSSGSHFDGFIFPNNL